VTDHRELQRRYQNDPGFACIVKTLMQAMEQHMLTPLEVREAAMFAATQFAMLYGYPTRVDWNEP
jgi:hypothetical protein